jgi:myo-inositol-hexaphosphate 3-phosphohydrolase
VWGGRANVTNAGATKYTMYIYNPNGTKYLIHGKQGTIKQPLYTTSGKKISTAAVTVTSKYKMRVAFVVGKKTTIYFFSRDTKL